MVDPGIDLAHYEGLITALAALVAAITGLWNVIKVTFIGKAVDDTHIKLAMALKGPANTPAKKALRRRKAR